MPARRRMSPRRIRQRWRSGADHGDQSRRGRIRRCSYDTRRPERLQQTPSRSEARQQTQRPPFASLPPPSGAHRDEWPRLRAPHYEAAASRSGWKSSDPDRRSPKEGSSPAVPGGQGGIGPSTPFLAAWDSILATAQLPALALSQHPDEHGPGRPILLAVDQRLGEGARLRVLPELADPVGAIEVREHEDVEQLGAGCRPEGVQALSYWRSSSSGPQDGLGSRAVWTARWPHTEVDRPWTTLRTSAWACTRKRSPVAVRRTRDRPSRRSHDWLSRSWHHREGPNGEGAHPFNPR
jgi:hypothetical protein